MLNREQKQILAWSIAWEGTISLIKNRCVKAQHGFYIRTRMDVFNTNKKLLEIFKKFIGGYGYISLQRNAQKENWAKCHRWRTHGQKETYDLLKQIIDFLPTKKEQAKLLLEYIEIREQKNRLGNKLRSYSDREFEIYEEIHKLNQRGRKS